MQRRNLALMRILLSINRMLTAYSVRFQVLSFVLLSFRRRHGARVILSSNPVLHDSVRDSAANTYLILGALRAFSTKSLLASAFAK